MAYCKNCGHEVKDTDAVCANCGTRLDNIKVKKNEDTDGKGLIAGFLRADVLIVIAVLLLIPLVLLMVTKQKTGTQTEGKTKTEGDGNQVQEAAAQDDAAYSEEEAADEDIGDEAVAVAVEESGQTAEYVTIPDPALKYAVQRSMGTGDREITVSEAREVTSLNLSGTENGGNGRISDLTGLSAFRQLREIDLSDNLVSDLSELSGLENLTTLELEKNRVSDLTPLKDLKNLT